MRKGRIDLKAKSMIEQNNEMYSEDKKKTLKAVVVFVIGNIEIFLDAEPFIHALEEVSLDLGISVPILAIIISTIAPEIPEKISIMMLARKGAAGTLIPIVNILGSKILNITLLFAVAVFVSMIYHGFTTKIPVTDILWYKMTLVTAITIAALIPMLRN